MVVPSRSLAYQLKVLPQFDRSKITGLAGFFEILFVLGADIVVEQVGEEVPDGDCGKLDALFVLWVEIPGKIGASGIWLDMLAIG